MTLFSGHMIEPRAVTIYIEMRHDLSFVRSYTSVNLEDDSEATIITLNTGNVLVRTLNWKHPVKGLGNDLITVLKWCNVKL
ncbi:hypothetical protein I305_06697 [Cryptococcus gattii E566]|uniref:Uncharacterized protein n=1 Tax=Cryptococcus gattii EJB2 TaxID=1296103 RepID=A0ABR5BTT8_9TREE|nr:hypothetical protein I306_03934 [Cryptococcus gattii EJB2]KIY30814.1 hypothetical protein I305_06697 [Cryptococcus gattii E566]